MDKMFVRVLLILALSVSTLKAAELAMYWQGHSSDGQNTVELAVGQSAAIEIWVSLEDGDTLSTMFFSNETAAGLEQVGVTADVSGWVSSSVNGVFGEDQQFAVSASLVETILQGPGDFLIGTQAVKLTDAVDGTEIEIAFKTGSSLGVLDESGSDFNLVATSSDSADSPGSLHLGQGSPGYTVSRIDDVRDPLIIKVETGGSASTDNDGDGVIDDQDAFPNDPDETTDTDSDGTGDNADTDDDDDGIDDDSDDFPTDPNETTDTDGDGVGNNADTDDDGDGIADNEDDTPLGDESTNPTPTPTPVPSAGPCGVGIINAAPICLLGLCLLSSRRRGS